MEDNEVTARQQAGSEMTRYWTGIGLVGTCSLFIYGTMLTSHRSSYHSRLLLVYSVCKQAFCRNRFISGGFLLFSGLRSRFSLFSLSNSDHYDLQSRYWSAIVLAVEPLLPCTLFHQGSLYYHRQRIILLNLSLSQGPRVGRFSGDFFGVLHFPQKS